jgi:hypothetical protein
MNCVMGLHITKHPPATMRNEGAGLIMDQAVVLLFIKAAYMRHIV